MAINDLFRLFVYCGIFDGYNLFYCPMKGLAMAADVATYIGQFIRLAADKAFALAAGGATVIGLSRGGFLSSDTPEMWIAYAAAFGFWLLVAKGIARTYRWVLEWHHARPDYSVWKNRSYYELKEAAALLAREKPRTGMSRETDAWYRALRDVIWQHDIEFNERRVGNRTGWPNLESRIHKDNLREAIRKMKKRVPRWLR